MIYLLFMKRFTLLLFLFIAFQLTAQTDSPIVKVHFFYGSKPKIKYKPEEKKRFGGLHGGHVSMQIGDSVFSFVYIGRVHIFAHSKNYHSHWINEELSEWMKDTVNEKYASITVPLSREQFDKIKIIQGEYCSITPYDYAFFGMRCASSSYDVFAQLGFFKHRSRMSMVTEIAYPKLLRKRFFKLAKKNNWKVEAHRGSSKRKWERN
jgi:hypothetical protein